MAVHSETPLKVFLFKKRLVSLIKASEFSVKSRGGGGLDKNFDGSFVTVC